MFHPDETFCPDEGLSGAVLKFHQDETRKASLPIVLGRVFFGETPKQWEFDLRQGKTMAVPINHLPLFYGFDEFSQRHFEFP